MIQEIVGVGGMGRVYRAEQTTLGRTVAIKVIHPHLLGDEQTVARFYTEARAASRLNHPNSVGIIDFGRTDDGILYLAMEFLQGRDLAMVMQEEGPLPFPRICDVLVGTLDALGEAHALNIVHRDLKPENIILRKMRTGGDLVKVVDFGLATIVGPGNTSITRPGLVCGTPDYMSPEQGRGEEVDGRGDLYACGVVLFELLTDQLPYDDETPTRVVLRHINDPIPDPREVAPHRAIPDALAEIAIKALAKRPEDRYQTAADMAEAIRRARAQLTAEKARQVVCPGCGTVNPSHMRFCGACGNRLDSEMAQAPRTAPTAKNRASFYPIFESERRLIGREEELATIEALRREAGHGLVHVAVTGDAGVGKTRLLKEAAERFAELGDAVVGAGGQPFGIPLPYGPIRTIVAALLEVEPNDLGRLARDAGTFADPLTRAGLEELAEPRGVVGLDQSRAGAVAQAVATAIHVALARTDAERAVLLIDDLSRCDGLTHQVLSELHGMLRSDPVLLLTADLGPDTAFDATVLNLGGLDAAEAQAFLDPQSSESGAKATLPAPGGRRLLPLYLEQIHALGAAAGDSTLPPRLADAVAQRIERLEVRSRRVLQTLAAFGGQVDLRELKEIIGADDLAGLDELRDKALVQLRGTAVEIAHPFIAELVEAFIPASARKELHARILKLKTDASAPLEVRAEHAYRGGDTLPTLMTLERMGDAAIRRGDPRAAILAYRRALDLARREMLEAGETVLDTAIVTFSRKLGWALALQGELAGADGVVREALDLTHRHDPARARMLLVLGRVSLLRARPRDAMRHFGQALEIVAGVEPSVESEVQLALGRMRRDAGDPLAAANAYRRALELYDQLEAPPLQRALPAVELAEVLFAAGERGRCLDRAQQAQRLARLAHAPAIEARALGLLAKVDELDGSLEAARRHYASAAELAATGGDASQFRRWTDAQRLLAG